ncbi:hypothetical protein [Bdellovibrio reynosensis]|uniref:Lipoprotein n=1 Tax=Bdellovibrio reynosensis TaxID=2835041 RepID=A0ABY4C5Y4_9BACT|nr:hypothetical protein [Bdellovibrio reynosensis]UOF00350.1 hypothetical protein MNR06_11645 [Bdellovibrio reynosensis]
MKHFFVSCLFLSTVLLSSCTTGGVILRETPLSVSETRRVIVGVIGEPRSISQNGREIVSQFYDKKNKSIEKMDMAKERFYSHLTILGDRRPYDVQVEVLVEGRNEDGGFDLVDRDDDKAGILAERLRQALNQSRDTRNVIDDFRSF